MSFVRKQPKTATPLPVVAGDASGSPSTAPAAGRGGGFSLPPVSTPIPAAGLSGLRSWLNGLQLASCGLPVLDAVYGGGIPVGSIVLIKEDEQSCHYDTIMKYFISEGIATAHAVCSVSTRNEAQQQKYLKYLPRNITLQGEVDDEKEEKKEDDDKEKDIEDDETGDGTPAKKGKAGGSSSGNVGRKKTAEEEEEEENRLEEEKAKLKIAWQYGRYMEHGALNPLAMGLGISGGPSAAAQAGGMGGGGSMGMGDGMMSIGGGGVGGIPMGWGMTPSGQVGMGEPRPAPAKPAPRPEQPKKVGTAGSHVYDLSRKIASSILAANSPTHISIADCVKADGSSTSQAMYATLLTKIGHYLRQSVLNGGVPAGSPIPARASRVARIAIHSMAAPSAYPTFPSPHGDPAIIPFLHGIRGLIRVVPAVCVISFPAHLYTDAFTRRVEHLCDTVIQMQSFAGSGGDMSGSEFSDWDGLLQLQRIPLLHTLSATTPPDTLHYLFRMKRRVMALEKLSLPPELSRSDAPVPEQQLVDPLKPNNPSTTGCGSSDDSGRQSNKYEF